MRAVTRTTLAAALGLSLAVFTGPASAGDPARGEAISQPCQACHGTDGNSPNPAFPTIAGQYQSYLRQALADYASGARRNAIMQGFAVGLSEQDRADLAAYYSRQKGLTTVTTDR